MTRSSKAEGAILLLSTFVDSLWSKSRLEVFLQNMIQRRELLKIFKHACNICKKKTMQQIRLASICLHISRSALLTDVHFVQELAKYQQELDVLAEEESKLRAALFESKAYFDEGLFALASATPTVMRTCFLFCFSRIWLQVQFESGAC